MFIHTDSYKKVKRNLNNKNFISDSSSFIVQKFSLQNKFIFYIYKSNKQ